MIQANELMIGNILAWDYDSKQVEILNIQHSSAWIKMRGGKKEIAFFKDLRPIPLTPKILERCGFTKYYNPEKDHTIERWDFNGILLSVYSGVVRLQPQGTIIESLHQLQNLLTILGHKLEMK